MITKLRIFDLNPEQQDAVTCISGPLLILAGAGTGKTRVITSRIAYLIEELTPPEKILAVTFTNKAAREMKERIASLVPPDAAKAVTACTFHSLCVRILRSHAQLLGYKKNFSIFDDSDQAGLLKKVIARTAAKDESLDHKVALSLISKAKNQGWNAPPDQTTLLGAVYQNYQDELKLQNAMDFDDLLVQTVRLLNEFPEAREQWQNRYDQIMVDEFQDTNRLQLELVSLLAKGLNPNVCVVGDDDQSIYGWRGAEISNILEFEKHFPSPSIFKLEQNYRSTTAILDAANRLIRNNKNRRGKRLWCAGKEAAPVQVMAMPSDVEEAEFVVSEIAAQRESEKLPWEHFAVLFRMNAQSRLLENELRRLRIPYRVVGGKSFYDRREVKDLLAYLSAIMNPDDDQALLRIINTPPRGIGPTSVELALSESAASKCSVQETLSKPEFLSRCSRKSAPNITSFLESLQTLRIQVSTPGADLFTLISSFLDTCGYSEDLRRVCKTEEEFFNRESNLRDMLGLIQRYQQRSTDGLQGFLDEMNLDRDRQEDEEDSARGVTLITLHAAKGLEFPHVHLIGAEEALLPHSRSLSEGTLDEERRLFYVGITRAMKTLTITHCQNRKKYGSTELSLPSRFLKEIEGTGVVQSNYEEIMNQPADEDFMASEFEKFRAKFSS